MKLCDVLKNPNPLGEIQGPGNWDPRCTLLQVCVSRTPSLNAEFRKISTDELVIQLFAASEWDTGAELISFTIAAFDKGEKLFWYDSIRELKSANEEVPKP